MARAWLSSLLARWRAGRVDSAPAQERIRAILLRSGSPGGEAGLLAELSAELAAARPIEPRVIELVAAHLRGARGEEMERGGRDLQAHLDFWTRLAELAESPLARLYRADVLLLTGDRGGALAGFLDVVEGDPGLVHVCGRLEELADESEGEDHLRYRLVCLRAALVGVRPDDAGESDDDDYVRELYCEILDEHRGQPEVLARIRALGALLDQAVDRGDLPRAIIRRAPRSE